MRHWADFSGIWASNEGPAISKCRSCRHYEERPSGNYPYQCHRKVIASDHAASCAYYWDKEHGNIKPIADCKYFEAGVYGASAGAAVVSASGGARSADSGASSGGSSERESSSTREITQEREEEEESSVISITPYNVSPERQAAGEAFRRGEELEAAGNWKGAIAAYREAVKNHPGSAWYWFTLALACRHEKRYKEALEAINKAIPLDPKADGYPMLRDEIEAALGVKKTAPVSADAGEPDAAAWYALAQSWHGKNDDAKAAKAISRAIELEPQNAAYRDSRAAFYEETGFYDKALADIDEALRLEPGKKSRLERRKTLQAKLAQSEKENAEFDRLIAEKKASGAEFPLLAALFDSAGQAGGKNAKHEPMPKAEPSTGRRFCAECGAKLEGGAKFCPECGTKA